MSDKLILDPVNPLQTKVQTRDGRPVRLICVDAVNANELPIVGLIDGLPENWSADGSYIKELDYDECDLINVPAREITDKEILDWLEANWMGSILGHPETLREAVTKVLRQ